MISLFINSMAGYAFAKFRFRYRDRLFQGLLAAMVIPAQVAMLPLFLLLKQFGLINTYWGVIIPGMASIFGIFLIRQYLLAIPDSLLDAARMDGAGGVSHLLVADPALCRPILVTLAIFTFLGAWNDFMWPLIVADRQFDVYPAGGAGQSAGRARAGYRTDDGWLGADRAAGDAAVRGAAEVLHRRDHAGRDEGVREG